MGQDVDVNEQSMWVHFILQMISMDKGFHAACTQHLKAANLKPRPHPNPNSIGLAVMIDILVNRGLRWGERGYSNFSSDDVTWKC